MHVLTVRSLLADNGPGTQSLTIARELTKRGHEVTFATSGGAYAPTVEDAGYDVHVIPELAYDRHTPLDLTRAVWALSRIVKANRPSVIHGHNAAATACAYLAGLTNGWRLPCVTSVRGVEERESHAWRNRIWKHLPGKLLAVCEKTKERLLSFGVPDEKIIVTYNGVEASRFDPSRIDGELARESLGIDGKLVVGTTGAMVGPNWLDGPSKGQHILVQAIANLKDEHPDLVALLVGDGPRRKDVERTAQDLGVAERIIFAGRRFDVPQMLSAMDIYALPSIWGEFFPNSIIEAMCMGKPWIGSDIAGLSELTANDEAGWVSAPGDVQALTKNLGILASDAALRQSRGEKARSEALSRFTIEKVVDRIIGAYEEAGAVLNRRSGAVKT